MPKLKLRTPPGNIVDNFWSYTEVGENGCIEWTQSRARRVHGHISLGRAGRHTITEGAHRLAWMLHTTEPIPEGIFVCHKCDNPPCCNPDHLFLGTQADNIRDMWRKGRGPDRRACGGIGGKYRITHCDNGHDLTLPDSKYHGWRGARCRICRGKGRFAEVAA